MKKLLTILALALAACSLAARQEAAKDGYTGQQMDCVKQFDSRPEIDACRARVREAWGLESAADAGKDGAK